MQLTTLTDYSLRVLIYASVKTKPASLTEIANAYQISRNHLIKAVNILEKSGFVATKRGPGGGVTLALPASEINIGTVVRYTEPSFNIVECFNAEKDSCCISAMCGLKGVLAKAKKAFMDELDTYVLSDLTKNQAFLAIQLGIIEPAQ